MRVVSVAHRQGEQEVTDRQDTDLSESPYGSALCLGECGYGVVESHALHYKLSEEVGREGGEQEDDTHSDEYRLPYLFDHPL